MKDEALGYFEPRPWHRDSPQRPKVWTKDPSASNLWGSMPPDEMMKMKRGPALEADRRRQGGSDVRQNE